MSVAKSVASLCVLGILMCSVDHAQSGRRKTSPPPHEQSSDEDVELISLKATEVIVPVTVHNRYGRPIAGLSKSDFIVYEDGKRQEVIGFDAESVPAQIVMLIDVSGSVRTEINDIRLSALALIDELGDHDRVCIMQFNDEVRVMQDWTSDKLKLQRALLRLPATGATAFYNALYDAAIKKLSRLKGRRTIIAFTDGVNTYQGKLPKTRGRHRTPPPPRTATEAFEAIRRAEVSVYVISKTRAIREFLTGRRSMSIFKAIDPRGPFIQQYLYELDQAEQWMILLAQRTGGRIYFPRDRSDLADVYGDIARELNNQYVLRYSPKNTSFDGRFRRIRVMTGNPAYIARAREGYYAVKR